ncbi:EIF3L [Mytilus edulis]|uniref:Eukaryotic translation initiation factor 3 subunit L n=1 Tax=Mytilus edulis TaxID=6550 RepID=A0A8S3UVM3_MYTED|nr:EIF3L [Mytilus edulis]
MPFDMLGTTRAVQYFQKCLPLSLLNSLTERQINARFDHEKYGIKPNYPPRAQDPLISDEFHLKIANGLVQIRPNVKHFMKTSVVFVDGSVYDDIDVVIFATGYKIGFPYVDKKVTESRDNYYPAYPQPGATDYDAHTGDPRQDLEYERQYAQQSVFKAINDQNLYEIQNAYENGFNKLTDRFFKTTPWPESEIIAPIVQNDHTFLVLYKELYYRHIYARVQTGPTLEQMFESYYNYCNLFNFILNAEGPVHLELPNQWLWDIIDEFIYQFQCFSIHRSKIGKKSEDEINVLRGHPKIWNVHSVLNVLHSLVEKSSINRQLEVYTSGGDPESVAGEFGQHSLYKMLGYFSLIGLLRLHSLLGDYYQALKVLESIDFNKKNMYSRVPACQITTFYYVGFCYMMMRRYQDAIRTLSNVLLYIQRTKQMFQSRAQLYDQITKMNDKMYTLLAQCLVLHPMRIDESVHSQLREKFADKMLRMQKGDIEEFTSNFSFACPKFLSPVPPNYDTPSVVNHKVCIYIYKNEVYVTFFNS